MAPILAQMRGDAVGARLLRDQGGADRIGMVAAARVPDRRDMVDIDAEAEVAGRFQCAHASALRLPGFSAGMAASSGGSASAGIGRHVEAEQREEGDAEIGRAARAVDQRGGGDHLAARRLDRRDRLARARGRW